MEEDRVVGSFHFRLTNSGNLVGEYFNNHGNVVLTESSNRIEQGFGFVGTYITSWLEGNDPFRNRLIIMPLEDSNMFSLIWKDLRGLQIFQGKATLLENNIIYGYYSNEPFIQEINE